MSDGFFQIELPDGEIAYTRDGHFEKDANGTLRTSAGFAVASQGGGDITIPRDSTSISIDRRGMISNQNGVIAQISISEFANVQQLEPLGNNLYTTDAPANAAIETTVHQGRLEGSNVQTVIEVTRMIDTLREFQNVQKLLQSEGDRLRGMIERLTERS